jgi:hypothetical protein
VIEHIINPFLLPFEIFKHVRNGANEKKGKRPQRKGSEK